MVDVRVGILLAAASVAGAAPGEARAVVLGGGAVDRDCRVAWSGVDATDGASEVVCVDGAACDTDHAADGVCSFAVGTCVGVAQDGCAGVRLDRIDTAGVVPEPPALPAADGTCGPLGEIPVPVGTVMAGTVLAWDGRELRDVDYLNLCCVAAADPLAAARCAVQVDPSASGCEEVPRRAVRAFERARDRVAAATDNPTRARRLLRKAARKAGKARKVGRRLAKRESCGNALGLMATHARDVLRAAR
jgi:hypothetical protein